MINEEKRKHSRTDSLNLLNYIYLDKSQDEATQGMGRTLNVSESGILLETHFPIEKGNTISLTIGFKEDMVDIKGRIVYSKKNASGAFESGIEFFDMEEQSQKVLRRYTAAFNAKSS